MQILSPKDRGKKYHGKPLYSDNPIENLMNNHNYLQQLQEQREQQEQITAAADQAIDEEVKDYIHKKIQQAFK